MANGEQFEEIRFKAIFRRCFSTSKSSLREICDNNHPYPLWPCQLAAAVVWRGICAYVTVCLCARGAEGERVQSGASRHCSQAAERGPRTDYSSSAIVWMWNYCYYCVLVRGLFLPPNIITLFTYMFVKALI